MEPSTRTPEGEPNCCPVCGKSLCIEPSRPPGDAPCPHCGHLLWFEPSIVRESTAPERLHDVATDVSVKSFWDLLRQSDLVSRGQMKDLMKELSGEGAKPDDPRDLAIELVKRGVLTEWQSLNLLQRRYRGFRLGPYRILKPAGGKAKSKVFLAEYETMHRRCAIKVLPREWQQDTALLARLYREAQAAAVLDHPNLVRVYDFKKDNRYGGKPLHFVVMEYVEGPNLREMVAQQGPLDYRRAVDFVAQAADGLACAHDAGFIHRDINPANMLVDRKATLKIANLFCAISKADDSQSVEDCPSAVGTADYIAPEQVMDSRHVDGRADIYSLGLTFCFLLTGRRPFPKTTLVELLMAHRYEQPEPIARFRPDVPPQLTAVIDRMTAKQPADRFQTAKEVAATLRSLIPNL
jgi:eukaryotic-like serine/threonine-protein kinase